MSARTDRERRRAGLARRIEQAESKLKRLVVGFKLFCEGVGPVAAAERLEVVRTVVFYDRKWLGLEDDRRSLAAKRAAAEERLRKSRSVIEVYRDGFRAHEDNEELWGIAVYLELETGKQWKRTGRRTGRLSTRAALDEVRP